MGCLFWQSLQTLVSHDTFIVANFNGRCFDKINSFYGFFPKPCRLRTYVSSKTDQVLRHCFNESVVAKKELECITINLYLQKYLIERFEATKATMMKHNDDYHDYH